MNINPGSRLIALKNGIENGQLPESIHELRVLWKLALPANRNIKTPKNLLECVVVPFAVAAGKIGVTARLGREK